MLVVQFCSETGCQSPLLLLLVLEAPWQQPPLGKVVLWALGESEIMWWWVPVGVGMVKQVQLGDFCLF